MSGGIFDYEIDNLTLVLLLAIVATLLYERVTKPTPLVHPLLLGRQSEVSAVRQEGESGVYRSFATGHGTPFIIRPANTLKTVNDAVQPVNTREKPVQRNILDVPLTDEALGELQRLLPLGIRALFPFKSPQQQTSRPILVLLPPSPSTSLPLLLLSLASSPSSPLIILPTTQLLIQTLEAAGDVHDRPGLVVTHESIAEGVIEQVAEVAEGKCGVLICGDTSRRLESLGRKAAGHEVNVQFWEDLWAAAEDLENTSIPSAQPSDVHSHFYESDGSITKFTHQNFTAGVAGLLSLFPADKRPSQARNDVVASAIPLTQPIGMTIAIASVWSGAGFRLIGAHSPRWDSASDPSSELEALVSETKTDRPSIIFGTSQHHATITSALQRAFLSSPLAKFVVPSKQLQLQAGHISRQSLWDKFVWRGLRASVLRGVVNDGMRALIIVGDTPNESQLGLSTLLLSLAVSRISASPSSAGPLTVSHFYDIQSPPIDPSVPYAQQKGGKAHSGPPANNVELVIRGVNESGSSTAKQSEANRIAKGFGAAESLEGELWARGPALGTATGSDRDGWVKVAAQAQVKTNGTFVVV